MTSVPDEAGSPDAAGVVVSTDDAVRAWLAGREEPPRAVVRAAVKQSLAMLAAAAPGRTVEVRVPPFAAVQCVSGLQHGRGTPPNVVETDARTWLALAGGSVTWDDAVASGVLRASGSRSNEIALFLPQAHLTL